MQVVIKLLFCLIIGTILSCGSSRRVRISRRRHVTSYYNRRRSVTTTKNRSNSGECHLEIKKNAIIRESDYTQSKNINNKEFCSYLNDTWFHDHPVNYYNYKNPTGMSMDDLKEIKKMYMEKVYMTNNFNVTWSDPNNLTLKYIDELEIQKYYLEKCPREYKSIEKNGRDLILILIFVIFVMYLFI